ncbi:hypothetical protein FJT64_014250 [Amphibalanus amphitrite]|uniref:Follistatin-like domain-containing protein n=1 Tax=Amphibalanus amphitrite TaxID=1232801 RepID=A0A6A4V9L2_AMPAM|nr:prespore protein Dp87-like [Amphibalanus amphitrite]KAF0287328.1 hypothetical protein FJT64_014250 [Amphibalanus amphitrite]
MIFRSAVLLMAVSAAAAYYGKKPTEFVPQTCNKQCGANEVCEVQVCHVCVPEPPSCKNLQCKDTEFCEDTPTGPVCRRKTCAHIKCAAGEECKDTADGPDCVPDVPSCEGFFCRRGTNCYIRGGSPICLPNTCEVRECQHGLTCIDTPSGALCRRGKKTKGCGKKYCPPNTMCENGDDGPTCKII